jgi:hypothetical protein
MQWHDWVFSAQYERGSYMKTGQWLRHMNNYVEDLVNDRLAELEALCTKYDQDSEYGDLIAKARQISDAQDLVGFAKKTEQLQHAEQIFIYVFVSAKYFYDVLDVNRRIQSKEIQPLGFDSSSLLAVNLAPAIDWFAKAELYYRVEQPKERENRIRKKYMDSVTKHGVSVAEIDRQNREIANLRVEIEGLQEKVDKVVGDRKKGAIIMLGNNPIQQLKSEIKNQWRGIINKTYGYKAQFARAMVAKYPNIKDTCTITGWCLEWEREEPTL